MLTRAITGTVYVAVVVVAIYFGGLVLQATFGLLGILMLMEFYQMFGKTKIKPNHFLGLFLGLILYILSCYAVTYPSIFALGSYIILIFVIFSLVFSILAIIEIFRKSENPILNIVVTIGGLAYIMVPMFLIVMIDNAVNKDHYTSIFPLLAIFIMVWCSDTFAYLVGKQFGKTKMIERLSPNKTWEGFAGGLVFSTLAGLIIAYFVEGQPYVQYGLLGLLVAIFGTLGDLVESMFKRSLGLKDSGTILPGHGGLLDRLDSILVVIPVTFVYLMALLMN